MSIWPKNIPFKSEVRANFGKILHRFVLSKHINPEFELKRTNFLNIRPVKSAAAKLRGERGYH